MESVPHQNRICPKMMSAAIKLTKMPPLMMPSRCHTFLLRNSHGCGSVGRSVADFVSSLASCERAFYRGQIAEARLFALLGLRPEYVK